MPAGITPDVISVSADVLALINEHRADDKIGHSFFKFSVAIEDIEYVFADLDESPM